MMARATVVLPQPDSPTRPTQSPCCRDSETSTTAGMSPSCVLYETCKPSTLSKEISIRRQIPPPYCILFISSALSQATYTKQLRNEKPACTKVIFQVQHNFQQASYTL